MDDMDDEIICCNICSLNYSLENNIIAMTIKCGHSFCKNCLIKFKEKSKNNSFECPLCRKIIKFGPNSEINNNDNENEVWENKILNSICNAFDRLNNLFDINIEPLLSINIFFYYCQNCNMFISNYNFKSTHNNNLTEKHSINSLWKYSTSFFEIIRNNYNHYSFQDKDKLFMCLFYFYNSTINKFEFIAKRKMIINSGEYNFYGQILETNTKKELSINIIKVMLQNIKSNIEEKMYGALFKGILTKAGSKFKIHGIFYIIQNNKEYIIQNAFGLYNYNDNLFFGFIRINKNNEITFDCGLLYYNSLYLFGIFTINENKENELKEGEIISNNGTVVKIVKNYKKNEINNDFQQEKPKIILKKDTLEEVVITPLKLCEQNKLFSDIPLNSCKIFINKFNFYIIFNNNKANSFLLMSELKGEKNKQLLCLYSFNVTVSSSTDIIIIEKLRNYKSKDISKNENEFLDYINRLTEIPLTDCEIYYKLEKANNILNNDFLISGKYYSIYPIKEKIVYKEDDDELKRLKNRKLKHSKIKDLFNILDDMKKTPEATSCKSCLIS